MSGRLAMVHGKLIAFWFRLNSEIVNFLDKKVYRALIMFSAVFFKYTRRRKTDKIFLIADFEKFGGTRTYLLTLLNFYHAENKKVTVFVKAQFQDADMEETIKKLGFKFYVLPPYPVYRSSRFERVQRLFLEAYPIYKYFIKFWPDLLVVTTAGHFDLLGNIVLPSRFIYILHSYPREVLEYYYRSLLVLNVGTSKKIVTVSHFSKEKILHHWYLQNQSGHVHVIYNSLDNSNQSQATIGAVSAQSEPVLKVLTLGHTVYYKNPLLWIEVAKKVIHANKPNKIEFVWVGDGELFEACRKKVEELQLQDIYFVGYHKVVDAFYINATIYFQPSLLESFGLSVLTAMSYKLPSVVSNTGGLPELVTDGVTGFVVDVSDTDTMAQRISHLLNNEALRKQMGLAAYELYEEKFSYPSWINNMTNLHELIV